MSDFTSNDKIKTRHIHTAKRFIDDIDTLNDGGVFNNAYKEICYLELQLKFEHSDNHARDGVFV